MHQGGRCERKHKSLAVPHTGTQTTIANPTKVSGMGKREKVEEGVTLTVELDWSVSETIPTDSAC